MINLFLAILVVAGGLTYESLSHNSSQEYIIQNGNEHFLIEKDQEDKRFSVHYELKEKDIYIECKVKDFSFNKDDIGTIKKEGEGHIQLYINEHKVDSVFQSSFVIKSLPSGTYKIRLELIHNDYTPYGVHEEFEITL
ncbi:hypothetical protein BKP45_19315 [Anaerobacillus alkalidiazotrophicus]|uniref:Uncharacterized protein n=1 Tax=Anaerobacillus alkalidiazotrophicus TaxID=472963 RepID=A0A1S2LZ20_9BACI|nr:hypothetical protein [Anaerobacillus alkalidiazotrophicus]OIJ17721.1 hypothetical protein BKP45_19315 [Anaerobacillus alkalidiazotrophicus]